MSRHRLGTSSVGLELIFLFIVNSDGWNPSPLRWSDFEEVSRPRKNPGYGATFSGMALQRTLLYKSLDVFNQTLVCCKNVWLEFFSVWTSVCWKTMEMHGKPVTVPATSWFKSLIDSALYWPGFTLCYLVGFLPVPTAFFTFLLQDVVPVIVDYCLLLQRT